MMRRPLNLTAAP